MRSPFVLPAVLADPIARRVKQTIVEEIRSVFNDRSRGEKPVVRRRKGLFEPDSIVRQVHGDVTPMMAGGVASLLLQMLHPGVLAGVWDHSNFRHDMLGRLRRTARFIAITTYGGREEAEAAIARVKAIHSHVRGALPDGTPYSADDPRLLAWVHVTETVSFLDAASRYGAAELRPRDRDRYVSEMTILAEALGADPVPRTYSEARSIIRSFRPELVCDARTREVARFLLTQKPRSLASAPFQALAFEAAIDLLPDWARDMHGLPRPRLLRPLIRAATFGVAGTIRWAFD